MDKEKSLLICVKDWMNLVLRDNTRLALKHTATCRTRWIGQKRKVVQKDVQKMRKI